MHLVKTLLSGVLLLTSVLWLGIQQLFLPNDIVSRLFIQRPSQLVDFLQLRRDWCRVRSKKISWQEMKKPCQHHPFMNDRRYATNPKLSQVSQVIVKPVGEYSLVRVETYTSFGILKTFGGDSFRVTFQGPNVVSATVFDLRNGSYDALALLLSPGVYTIKVTIDYTQCNGYKDPPTEWYVKAHCAGRGNRTAVPQHISSQMFEYLNIDISPGIFVKVLPERYNLKKLSSIVSDTDCGFACNNVWDGHGVWKNVGDEISNNIWQWKSYIQQTYSFHSNKSKQLALKPRTLWVYGDSISYYSYNRLKDREICNEIFTNCKNTYNWIYPKTLYEVTHFCEDVDVNIERIKEFFNKVINHNEMGEESVLIFNLGAHFVKNTSFRKYKLIIDTLLKELKWFKGTAIWRSTAAIHVQNVVVMGAFRRYLTNQRVQLFNAYANAAVCNTKHRLLDVYPLTASYPYGTKDGVHYHRNASHPMETMLSDYFSVIRASLDNTINV